MAKHSSQPPAEEVNESTCVVQTLSSIMNTMDPVSYLNSANIHSDYIVVNQITEDHIIPSSFNTEHGQIISVKERGLSKSRNLAFGKAKRGGVIIFADDDVVYDDDYKKTIVESFRKCPSAGAIAFILEYEDGHIKKKVYPEGRMNYHRALSMGVIYFAFRVDILKEIGVLFDERFGAGTDNIMGEDNIFISDCIKKGINLYYVPKRIGIIKKKHESTWFDGFNKKYFLSRGAVFRRLNPAFFWIFIIRFAVLKYGLYRKDGINMISAITYMMKGALQLT